MIFNVKRIQMLMVLMVVWFAQTASAKVKVVATVPQFAWMVDAIGGEYVETRYLATPTQDPHYVDARPSFIPYLNKADMLVLAGLQLEAGWLPSLIQNARNTKINVGTVGYVDASTVIQMKGIAMGLNQPVTRALGDLHPGGNPHYYFDPYSMRAIIPFLVERLSTIDPEHALYYKESASELDARLTMLIEKYQPQLKGLKVVGYHLSFQNLFNTFGIENPINVEPFPGIPPSPKHIAKVSLLLKNKGADGLLAEVYYPKKIIQTVAQIGQATLILVPPGQKKQDIVNWFESILKQLAKLKIAKGVS